MVSRSDLHSLKKWIQGLWLVGQTSGRLDLRERQKSPALDKTSTICKLLNAPKTASVLVRHPKLEALSS